MIPFGKYDLLIDPFAYLVHDTPQVPARHIGRNDDLATDVLAADRIRPAGRNNVGHVAQRYFPPVGIDDQITDPVDAAPALVIDPYGQIEGAIAFIHLRNDLATEHNRYILSELGRGDAVFGEHLAFRLDFDLRTFDLLLYVQVGNPLDIGDTRLNPVAEREHTVQVRTEQLDGNIGSCAR